ncbi:hypothetical protein ACLI4Q_05370 [Natrialbaceae archaeon A-CW1-1]
MGYSLDNLSNVGGGGGGTQLHLSSGTISSGAEHGPAQPRQHAQQPAGADAVNGHQNPQHESGEQAHPTDTDNAPHEPAHDTASRVDDQSVDSDRDDEDTAGVTGDDTAEDGAVDADEVGDTDPETADDGDDTLEDDTLEDDLADSTPHPMAEHNRGRFITPPPPGSDALVRHPPRP